MGSRAFAILTALALLTDIAPAHAGFLQCLLGKKEPPKPAVEVPEKTAAPKAPAHDDPLDQKNIGGLVRQGLFKVTADPLEFTQNLIKSDAYRNPRWALGEGAISELSGTFLQKDFPRIATWKTYGHWNEGRGQTRIIEAYDAQGNFLGTEIMQTVQRKDGKFETFFGISRVKDGKHDLTEYEWSRDKTKDRMSCSQCHEATDAGVLLNEGDEPFYRTSHGTPEPYRH